MGKKPIASAPSTPRATRSNALTNVSTPSREAHPTTGGLRKPPTKVIEKAKSSMTWVKFRAETVHSHEDLTNNSQNKFAAVIPRGLLQK